MYVADSSRNKSLNVFMFGLFGGYWFGNQLWAGGGELHFQLVVRSRRAQSIRNFPMRCFPRRC